MELCEFHDRIYGKYEGQLYVFEPTWDSFRPIEYVGWNGSTFQIEDSKFKQDLFAPYYGYGSLEQKALCRKLIQETELEDAKKIDDAVEFWKWSAVKSAKWWYDRPCVFSSPCVSRDGRAWKQYLRYLNVRAKTLRNKLKSRVTKRLVAK